MHGRRESMRDLKMLNKDIVSHLLFEENSSCMSSGNYEKKLDKLKHPDGFLLFKHLRLWSRSASRQRQRLRWEENYNRRMLRENQAIAKEKRKQRWGKKMWGRWLLRNSIVKMKSNCPSSPRSLLQGTLSAEERIDGGAMPIHTIPASAISGHASETLTLEEEIKLRSQGKQRERIGRLGLLWRTRSAFVIIYILVWDCWTRN